MRDRHREAALERDEDERLLDAGDDGDVQIAMATGEMPSVHWRRDSIRTQTVIDDDYDDDGSSLGNATGDGTASAIT